MDYERRNDDDFVCIANERIPIHSSSCRESLNEEENIEWLSDE